MPGAIFHQCLTKGAILSNNISNAENLIDTYCLYPDFYFEKYSPSLKKYLYFYDNIQFHYPPHTPVEEFYRYWNRDDNGNYPFTHHKNENIIHVEAGFSFYLGKIIISLKESNQEEAFKYLGCLLHFLEDSTFGVHALEGADGTDLFVLDRLFNSDIAKYLCSIALPEEFSLLKVTPKILTSKREEFVQLLYARYVKDVAISRQYLFDIAVLHQYKTSIRSFEENLKQMFLVALQLATDTIATIWAIVNSNNQNTSLRQLSDFSPYHYPIGGSNFALKKYEEIDNKITFGANSVASLLYNIPQNLYKTFTCNINAIGVKELTLELINQNKVVETLIIPFEQKYSITIPNPGGDFGFRIKTQNLCGKITISDGIFHF